VDTIHDDFRIPKLPLQAKSVLTLEFKTPGYGQPSKKYFANRRKIFVNYML